MKSLITHYLQTCPVIELFNVKQEVRGLGLSILILLCSSNPMILSSLCKVTYLDK